MAYNRGQAANYYIDPLTRLFCVKYNNAPTVGDYWIEKTELSVSDLESFTASPFRRAMEGVSQLTASSTLRMFYSIGDEMRAVLNGHAGKFSIPQADLNGFCSDYYSARFMDTVDRNFCTR